MIKKFLVLTLAVALFSCSGETKEENTKEIKAQEENKNSIEEEVAEEKAVEENDETSNELNNIEQNLEEKSVELEESIEALEKEF